MTDSEKDALIAALRAQNAALREAIELLPGEIDMFRKFRASGKRKFIDLARVAVADQERLRAGLEAHPPL